MKKLKDSKMNGNTIDPAFTADDASFPFPLATAASILS
jgi:hypothetical protein